MSDTHYAVSLETYRVWLAAHDWTYEHADDHRAWQRGRDSLARLHAHIDDTPAHRALYDEYVAHLMGDDNETQS